MHVLLGAFSLSAFIVRTAPADNQTSARRLEV
jgi:hypothetical protein